MGAYRRDVGARSTLGKESKAEARQILGIVGFAALLRPEAPGAEIDGVEGDAEEIGRNKAELRGTHTNHADDSTVDCGDEPTLPELLA